MTTEIPDWLGYIIITIFVIGIWWVGVWTGKIIWQKKN